MAIDKTFDELMVIAEKIDAELPKSKRPSRIPDLKLPSSRRLTSAERWASLLWSVDTAQSHGKHALRGLAVALCRIVHGRALEKLLFDARPAVKPLHQPSDLLWNDDVPLNASGDCMSDLLIRNARSPAVDLNDTPVFPCPWERWRLSRALNHLGEGRRWGAWRQERNHYGVAWRPWPLLWVQNGHHSTTAALVRGGGRFKPTETYDASALLRAVHTDGVNWYRADTDDPLGLVRSLPMAGIFVIGQRLIGLPARKLA